MQPHLTTYVQRGVGIPKGKKTLFFNIKDRNFVVVLMLGMKAGLY